MVTTSLITPSPTAKRTLAAASLLLFFGVMLGAFGAHSLPNLIPADRLAKALELWQTATLYLFVNALGLLLMGILLAINLCKKSSALCLGMGIFIFSGSLYLLALGLPKWLGAITPIGGLLMMAGWLLLFLQLIRKS